MTPKPIPSWRTNKSARVVVLCILSDIKFSLRCRMQRSESSIASSVLLSSELKYFHKKSILIKFATYWFSNVGIMTKIHMNACSINNPPSHAVLWNRFPQYAITTANIPWKIPLETRSQSAGGKWRIFISIHHYRAYTHTNNSWIIIMSQCGLFGGNSEIHLDGTLNKSTCNEHNHECLFICHFLTPWGAAKS